MAARLHIGRVHLVGIGVHVGLCSRAEPEAEAVEVILTAGRTVPRATGTNSLGSPLEKQRLRHDADESLAVKDFRGCHTDAVGAERPAGAQREIVAAG